MAKNGVFKKIAALAMAIVLVVCFAASASAVNVATKTTYAANNEIKVEVAVTGVAAGVNVTYYATKGDDVVYVDQGKSNGTDAVTFNFYTANANLNSDVKVGYTGASADTTKITGYTITLPEGSAEVSKLIPTEQKTIDFGYKVPEGFTVAATNPVSVAAGTAVIANSTYAEGNVSVTFTSISSDVTLAIALEAAAPGEPTATATFIDAAVIVADGTVADEVESGDATADDVKANAGDRKLTVIGQVNAEEYGIIVSETAIDSGIVSAADFALMNSYAGAVDNNGLFAIQVIDTSDEDSFILAGRDYYVAIYAKDAATNQYVIDAGETPVNTNNN